VSPRETKAHRAARLLATDARNRALRTFLQGLAIDVLVAAAGVIYAATQGSGPVVWTIVAASLPRTIVQSAASYVMRRFLDKSKIPTPLPPDPPGEPDKDAGHGELVLVAVVAVLAIAIALVLLLPGLAGIRLSPP
jgi:hypothetical protein